MQAAKNLSESRKKVIPFPRVQVTQADLAEEIIINKKIESLFAMLDEKRGMIRRALAQGASVERGPRSVSVKEIEIVEA
jgi:hypothetical protein